MNALVYEEAGQARTDSRTVAESFAKRHGDVIRSIDNLLDQAPELRERNFAFTSNTIPMPTGGTREDRGYSMDRDGFALLVMGFTGETALRWKLRFIAAFNAMERVVTGASALPVLPIEMETTRLHAANNLMRTAIRLVGVRAARPLWEQLGLPAIGERPTALPPPEEVDEWSEVVEAWAADRSGFTIGEVATGVDLPADLGMRERRRLGGVLRDLGFTSEVQRRGDVVVKVFRRSAPA